MGPHHSMDFVDFYTPTENFITYPKKTIPVTGLEGP
jgi:hypothetical protein